MSALISAGVFAAPVQASTVGTLTQLSAPGGCITDASTPTAGCGTGRAMLGLAPFFGSHAVALSPDGEYVYAAALSSNSVTVYSRNHSTGALKQVAGGAGCVTLVPTAGCASGRGLLGPTSVAVSPDGGNVYVASIAGGSVAVFTRNHSTGRLKQAAGSAGCVAKDAAEGCAVGRALGGADVVDVSPDGKNVYVGAFGSDAVTVFDRKSSTGSLAQKPGTAGCFTEAATSGCATGRGLNGAEGLTVSPDGKSVYVGAAVGNAVAEFRRNRKTGTLSQSAGTAGCVSFQGNEGCAAGDGLVGADALQVSPDDKNLYVASGVGSSVAVFKRNTGSGQITQLAGVAGCYSDHNHTLGRCNTGVQLDTPEGIAVSPDGRSVYVGSFNSSAVAVFDRVPFTGTITQRAGSSGCIVNVATAGCSTGTALGNANALAVSADGRNLYAGAPASNAIDAFSRAQPAGGQVAVSAPSRVTVPPGTAPSIAITCSGTGGRRCPGGIALKSASHTIGRGSFNIATHNRARVTVAISPSAQRALAATGSLATTAKLRVVEPDGQIRTSSERIVLVTRALG